SKNHLNINTTKLRDYINNALPLNTAEKITIDAINSFDPQSIVIFNESLNDAKNYLQPTEPAHTPLLHQLNRLTHFDSMPFEEYNALCHEKFNNVINQLKKLEPTNKNFTNNLQTYANNRALEYVKYSLKDQ